MSGIPAYSCCHCLELNGFKGTHSKSSEKFPVVFIKYSSSVSSAGAAATNGWILREVQVLHPLSIFLVPH